MPPSSLPPHAATGTRPKTARCLMLLAPRPRVLGMKGERASSAQSASALVQETHGGFLVRLLRPSHVIEMLGGPEHCSVRKACALIKRANGKDLGESEWVIPEEDFLSWLRRGTDSTNAGV